MQRYGLQIVAKTPAGALLDQFVPLKQELAQVTRGSFDPKTGTLALLQAADLSTFIHESGHFFLEVQADLAAKIQTQISSGTSVSDGERQIVADMERILGWFGTQGDGKLSALDRWTTMTLDEKRAHHEQWARGFERFVMEGQSARMSSAALETLAIVAYKQPLSRAQIAAIRGENVDGVMRTLNQRDLI
jgi:hypothetical protein